MAAAADRLRRACRAVLVPARRRRSLANSLRADRPSGAANDAAAARRPRQRRRAGARARSRRRSRARSALVNVWASWCVPCHDEAPLLTELAKDKRVRSSSASTTRTQPDNARRFLGRYGNPFGVVGVDGNGRAAIEWGVYGVPETFVVGRDGTHRLQAGRPGHAGESRHRAEGRDREGAEGGELSSSVIATERMPRLPMQYPRPSARATSWNASRGLSGAHCASVRRNDEPTPSCTSPASASLASSDTGSR